MKPQLNLLGIRFRLRPLAEATNEKARLRGLGVCVLLEHPDGFVSFQSPPKSLEGDSADLLNGQQINFDLLHFQEFYGHFDCPPYRPGIDLAYGVPHRQGDHC